MSGFLQDSAGNFSSTRVANLIVQAVCLLVWGMSCYQQKTILPLPAEVVGLMLGSQGIKTWQKKIEDDGFAVITNRE